MRTRLADPDFNLLVPGALLVCAYDAEPLFAYHPGSFTPLARITCQPHKNGKASVQHIDWFHTDQIGAPLALFDAQGNQTWTARFDAWGKRLDTPAPKNPRHATPSPVPPIRTNNPFGCQDSISMPNPECITTGIGITTPVWVRI